MAKRTVQIGRPRVLEPVGADPRARRAADAARASEVTLGRTLGFDSRGRLGVKPAQAPLRAASGLSSFEPEPGETPVETLARLAKAHNELLEEHVALVARHNELLANLETAGLTANEV